MKKILFLIFAVVVFTGCEKEIPFTGEASEPQLVVNCLMTTNENPLVRVSVSAPVTSNFSPQFIDDVVVEMWRGDIYLGEGNPLGQGTFQFEHVVQPGSYRLEVFSETYGTATAQTNIPFPTSFTIQQITEGSEPINPDFSGYNVEIDLLIDDPIEANYYQLYIIQEVPPNVEDITVFHSTDPSLEGGQDQETYRNDGWFADDAFNGQNYNLEFRLFEGAIQNEFQYRAYLHTLNEDYYLYTKSFNTDVGFLGEPVQVYTNIENGIGIFAGRSR
ncbi:MAG: DUF4249 domain-containing protein, partial [Flavobacteriales bacterium]|nr:DUF4249 domain-containing protein [Flavobacteriales bacterium]